MKAAVISFPGSNCDLDLQWAVQQIAGADCELIKQDQTDLSSYDVVMVPGGFSYGDYLRSGAIARFSPVMTALKDFADAGGYVLGICNGFQILTEAGLLPGSLQWNRDLNFICEPVALTVDRADTAFSNQYQVGEQLTLPIAHGEGNYYADPETLAELEANGQVVFRYVDNPNGSVHDIAGVTNAAGNVLGMMPHPERAVEALLGGTDGLGVFHSLIQQTKGPTFVAHVEMSPMAIAEKKSYLDLGLTEPEYERFAELIGHQPNDTEIGLASGMWSEHCAYKYSKPILRQFWTKNERVLMGPGEGAGVIDIGEGKAVVFKAESHNHPSAVEPYEGAATGVGGIIRDIFSIGAKPVAMLDSLAFGDLNQPHTQHLVDRIVAGIGGYGNAIGIPTVGGETNFDGSYTRNPLVNAMCVGIMDKDQIQKGKAAGVGNALIYVGAKTGRDGINGASFASSEFSDDEAADRSAVQVGDPFMEKLLMDACLEITQQHQQALVGIQDMGAAGLVSSSVEMAGKANSGMALDLDLIPQREANMTPFEIMLSESQERMLLCVRAGFEQEVLDVFAAYDLDAAVVGHVIEGHQYKLYHHGKLVCDVPVSSLTDDAPVYEQEAKQPERLANPAPDFDPIVTDPVATWKAMMRCRLLPTRHPCTGAMTRKCKPIPWFFQAVMPQLFACAGRIGH